MLTGNTARKESINRGSNLLVDLDVLRKEEFAQRRKIRIQQVRLQSKDISNKVLRDIRNEKDRQLKLNKAMQDDLFKKWQERKIFEVNLMYKENIKRVGSAYRDAEKQPDPEMEIAERFYKNSNVAKERGKKAFDQLRSDQEDVRMSNETRATRRERVKKIENMRSALISSLPPSGSNGKLTEKSSSLEEKSDFCSSGSKLRESEEFEEVTPSVIPELGLGGSTDRQENMPTTQTSCKSAQHHNQPVAFTIEEYDRSNPCAFTKRPPHTVRVERTSPDSQRNAREAAAMEEKFEKERQLKKENEKEVNVQRGKKALAKELVWRDFDRLMNRLGGLAREERLVRGLVEPPLPADMFMSESRCAARAQKRQRNMDSAFEGIFHGNDGVQTRGVSLVAEDVQPLPIHIEKANLPEEWLHTRQHIAVLSETPPEILNVGVQSKDTTCLSTPNSIAEDDDYNEDSTFNEAIGDVDPLVFPESERHGNVSMQNNVTELHKEDSVEETDAPVKLPSKPSTQMDVQEYLQEDIHVSYSSDKIEHLKKAYNVTDIDKGSTLVSSHSSRESTASKRLHTIDERDDADSIKKQKEEIIPKAEACTQTVDFRMEDESNPEIAEGMRVQREEAEGAASEISSSSTSGSSMKIDEVRVVLKFNDSFLKDASTEESAISPSATMQKTKKKKVIVWKKGSEVALDKEMKAVIDTASLILEDAKEPGSRILPVDNTKEHRRKKKRNKKDLHKSEAGLHVSPGNSSNPSPPSVENIAGERRAKALLEEVRSQRKELERLRAGLKPPPLGTYVRKLLSMTRENVSALSVSDVSTPSIHFTSPAVEQLLDQQDSQSQRKQIKENLATEMQKVSPATSPVPSPDTSVDERVLQQKLQEMKIAFKEQASTLESCSTKSSSIFSTSSTYSSIDVSSPAAVEAPAAMQPRPHPTRHASPPLATPSSPPLPPPPSPEYEQLTDQHSHRIHELGAQLEAVRELQKQLLSFSISSESEKSSSPSITVSAKSSESSSETVSSMKSDDYEPMKVSGPSWNLSDISLSAIEDLQDVSLHEDILVQLEKPSKPSQEETSLRRRPFFKSGPPPTPLKGLKGSVCDYQIPHELSTITEVDSKLISNTSVLESRKEKDSVPSFSIVREKPPVEAVAKVTPPEIPEGKVSEVQSPIKDSWKISGERVVRLESPGKQQSPLPTDILELIPENAEKITTAPEPLFGERSIDVESISPNSSTDSQLPQTLDDVLRMLGISPTIFKHPDSPDIVEPKSSDTSLPENVIQISSTAKDLSLPLFNSKDKTNVHDENLLVNIGKDSEQVSGPSKEFPHLSQSFGKSPFGTKETSSRMLMHSTPVQTSSSGTSSSSSDSKQKNISGFPFLGESAPSTISSHGTPPGSNWIHIDSIDSSAPKED